MIDASQMRAARGLIEWSQSDLAEKAGLSLPTIKRMEKLGPGRSSADNVASVQRALEGAGVIFLDAGKSEDGGPGVRLLKPEPSQE